jgi:hypothetical protein
MMTYKQVIHTELLKFCSQAILEYIPREKFFPCLDII